MIIPFEPVHEITKNVVCATSKASDQPTHTPVHELSNNVVCATSKASDQPAHTRSLIRGFASRLSVL